MLFLSRAPQGTPSLEALKLLYYSLMIRFHQHERNHLEVCRCYRWGGRRWRWWWWRGGGGGRGDGGGVCVRVCVWACVGVLEGARWAAVATTGGVVVWCGWVWVEERRQAASGGCCHLLPQPPAWC